MHEAFTKVGLTNEESREVKRCQRRAGQGVKSSCAKVQWQECTKHHVWSGVDIVQGFAEDGGKGGWGQLTKGQSSRLWCLDKRPWGAMEGL